jgi:protein-S-isoprenylcysteine O-methyltransferase Ste14
MWLFRVYLLLGLLVHKAVWEVLKRRRGVPRKPAGATLLEPVKAVKVGMLIGIVAQTLWPADVLPLSSNPLWLRIVGGTIYSLGLMTAMWARLQLGNSWSDIETPEITSAQAVVTTGLYRYIRHPIYMGDLALLLGLELALNSWLVLGVAALVPAVLRQAIREEKMLLQQLPGYESYSLRTKRFIPFVV